VRKTACKRRLPHLNINIFIFLTASEDRICSGRRRSSRWNPLHDWTNLTHGDLCQRIPVVSAEQHAELAESLAAERHQLQLSKAFIANLIGDLTDDDADALLDWIVEQDPSDETAAASVARQAVFGERLRAYYLQESEP
jgi:hypothetical protein